MQLTRLTRRAMAHVRLPAVVRDLRHVAAATLIIGLAACSEDNTTPIQTPAIAITTGLPAATASPGSPAQIPVALTRSGGFTGDVAIAVEGMPTGITAVAAPTVMGTGVVGSIVTVSVGPNATPGNSTLTIRGIGNGVTASTATVALTVTVPAAITLSAGAATVSAPQGGSQTVGISVDRAGGFNGAVTLAAEGLPAGVTAVFAPSSIASGTNNSTLTLNVGLAAVVATTPITIRATGAGVTDKTVVVQLTVTASTTPDFTVSATPAALSVLPGGNIATTIAVARSGPFTGSVSLATGTLPAGVTAAFNPNPATANTSALTFTTTNAAVPGVYTIAVTGSATGLTSRSTNVVLTVATPPGIVAVLTPVAGSALTGASVQSSLAITRVGGLTGDVTMTAENVPANVTVTFNPSVVTANSSVVTFAAAANATPGVYTINLRGTSAGGVTTVVPYTFTVTASQGITVAFASPTISIVAGGTGALTANITRTGGFTGAVNFTVSGLPAGITSVVNPASVPGASTSVELTVGGAVAAGTYTGTLTGTGTGIANSTTTFTVTVTAGGGGSGNVSWAFCDPARVPVFFAFRDGTTGNWTRVTPNASNVFLFTINQPVGGVAYVLPNGSGFATSVYLQTAAEMQLTANNECTSFPTGLKTLTGSVAGIAPSTVSTVQQVNITMGGASTSASFGNTNFNLNGVRPGAVDLLAVRNVTTLAPFSIAPDAIVIRRGLNLASGSAITPTLNFVSGGESVAPVTGTLTITNGGTDILNSFVQFTTANGTSATLGFGSNSATATVYGVPSASLVAGDLHQAFVGASDNTATSTRAVISYFKDFVSKTIALGPVLSVPTVSAAVNTVLRPRTQGTFQPEYPTGVGVSYTQSGTNRAVTVTASKGYFGSAATTFDLDTPDLAGVTGFQATWGLSQGFATSYSLTATNASTATFVDGSQYGIAARTGSVPAASLRANTIRR